MVKQDAEILYHAAAANQEALRIATLCEAAQAPASMIEDARANSLNAGMVLRMAIERFLRTL